MKGFGDVIKLVIISLVAGLCLSLVFATTKDKIEISKKAGLEKSLKEILPFMKDRFEEIEYDFENQKFPVYAVREPGGALSGAAVRVSVPEGYGGAITVLVGIEKTKQVTGLRILEHKETPGLGTKAANQKFWGQFIGKSLSSFKFKVKKDKGDVDAITAATITSRAVSHAIEKGLQVYEKFSVERGAK